MPVKLPTSGRIKFSELRTQFSANLGAGDRVKFSDFYKKGDYVVQSALNDSIPLSGTIKMTEFYGKGNPQRVGTDIAFYLATDNTWNDFGSALPGVSLRDSGTQLMLNVGLFWPFNGRENEVFEVRDKSTQQVLTPTYSLTRSEDWQLIPGFYPFVARAHYSSHILVYNIGTISGLEWRFRNDGNNNSVGCTTFSVINNTQIASNSTLIDSQSFFTLTVPPADDRFDLTLDMEEGSWGGGVWSAWGITPGGESVGNQPYQNSFVNAVASNSSPSQQINTAFNRQAITRNNAPTVPGTGGLAQAVFSQFFGYDTRTTSVSRGKSPMNPVDGTQDGCCMILGASFRA